MVEQILRAIDMLEQTPHRQRVVTKRKTGTIIRSLPVPPYMVFFQVSDENLIVEILRIRHGARRPLKRF